MKASKALLTAIAVAPSGRPSDQGIPRSGHAPQKSCATRISPGRFYDATARHIKKAVGPSRPTAFNWHATEIQARHPQRHWATFMRQTDSCSRLYMHSMKFALHCRSQSLLREVLRIEFPLPSFFGRNAPSDQVSSPCQPRINAYGKP
jgi:hypothetical protein